MQIGRRTTEPRPTRIIAVSLGPTFSRYMHLIELGSGISGRGYSGARNHHRRYLAGDCVREKAPEPVHRHP